MEVTACAMASGSLSAAAPLSAVRISASAEVRETTAGVPHAKASSAARPNVSCGPGASATSARRQDGGDGVAAPDVTGEVDGQARRLAFEPGAHRTFADHDQSGINTRVLQGGNGIDTSVRMLLHRQPAAVHQQGLFRAGPLLPNRRGPPAGMELVEVDPEWHRDHIRGMDPVELFARERRRAHHGVVALGGAAVGGVGDRPGRAGRKYLPDKAIKPFMGDHHGGDVAASAPFAQRPKCQPVRHLEGIRCQLGQNFGDRPRQHSAISAGERDKTRRQRDSNDSRWQLMPFGDRPRHHQEDFVAPGAVFRAQTIDCRAQAPRTRAVEVRDLHHPHELNLTWTHVRSTTRHQRSAELRANSVLSRAGPQTPRGPRELRRV